MNYLEIFILNKISCDRLLGRLTQRYYARWHLGGERMIMFLSMKIKKFRDSKANSPSRVICLCVQRTLEMC